MTKKHEGDPNYFDPPLSDIYDASGQPVHRPLGQRLRSAAEPTEVDMSNLAENVLGLLFASHDRPPLTRGQRIMGGVADALGMGIGVGLMILCGYGAIKASAPDADCTTSPAATVTSVGPDRSPQVPSTAPVERRSAGVC